VVRRLHLSAHARAAAPYGVGAWFFFRISGLNKAEKMEPTDPKALQNLQDSVDTLHRRMDRFYEWAAELQVQIRNLQRRQEFLESQAKIDVSQSEDAALQARLARMKNM
jgi:hypothetical protein